MAAVGRSIGSWRTANVAFSVPAAAASVMPIALLWSGDRTLGRFLVWLVSLIIDLRLH